ncbi:spore coat protein U-like protein [Sphingopyxis panaciterrae]|uniref:Csu type fimbrial protein n=1 Tax=Sphingopyxis panaciterrae TaxID=363841 RepID=UPI00141E4FFE|nr:spore coat U domain-containing protein [Sphingopyxis panaciterrae]NIJ35932.1 spore coat protein U-like protein [Sphingopyxis panaciterrae]
MPAPRPSTAFAALAVLVACGIGGSAQAETTAQFDVSATITAGCLVDGLGASGNAGRIGELDFGVDSTFSTATHTATTTGGQAIRLRCTPGANLMMSIDGGSHAAVGVRNLQLGANSSARIAYSLCRDIGCTQPIAIGTAYAVPVSGTNSEDVRLPIYGSLTLPGTRPPGPYTDTLTVTLTW